MLDVKQLEQAVKSSAKISELLGEYIDMKTRLVDLKAERMRAIELEESDFVNGSFALEDEICGLLETDERIIMLHAQLIEEIVS